MSSIASFYRLNRVDLPSLVEAAGTERKSQFDSPAYSYLREHADELPEVNEEFDWSGYGLLYLLTFLEDSGIDLGSGAVVDCLRALREQITALTDEQILIVHIG